MKLSNERKIVFFAGAGLFVCALATAAIWWNAPRSNAALLAALTLTALAVAVLSLLWACREGKRRRATEEALRTTTAEAKALSDHAPCAYLALDVSGKITALNATGLAWLRYELEQIIGLMKFTDLLPKEEAWDFEEHLVQLKQTGTLRNLEYELARRDGARVPLLLNATAIYDREGHYVGSRMTLLDISDRRTAEDERDQLFLISRELVCIVGFDGRFRRTNPAWTRTLGNTQEELLEQPLLERVHSEDRERTAAAFAGLEAGHDLIAFENRYRCKDGTYRWLLWSARALPAERLVFASARDITGRRRDGARIQRLNAANAAHEAQLEAANHELESFSYSVSHDLRAPLRHIDGFASLLQKRAGETLDSESQRYLETISRAAKHMGLLIDDLLAFSRIGRATLRRERVDQDALVAEIVAARQQENAAKQIAWAVGPLPPVRADAAMLREVWLNLIDNAVKFSASAAAPRITIGVTEEPGGETAFFVRDNGVGFDMAYADKLFGVFQRLHGQDYEGTGIGLAKVRRIVARHGGQTWANGKVGEGATFFFTLGYALEAKP